MPGRYFGKSRECNKTFEKRRFTNHRAKKAILNVLAHADTPLSAEENHANLTTEQ